MSEPLHPSAPALKRLRRLSGRRSSRRGESRFLLDGPVLLAEALDADAAVEVVYAEPDADPALLDAVRAAGIPVTEVAGGSLRKVLDLVTPRSVVAVVEQRHLDAGGLLSEAQRALRPVLVLVGIQDPGNAGTLVRIAEAAGCTGVILTEGSVDPWNPKTVRATAGAVLRVPVAVDVAVDELIRSAAHAGSSLVATVAHGGAAPENTDLGGFPAILVGSEAHGLPNELLEAADALVTIPMEGTVESLNAAVSGALVAFESARQRRGTKPVGSGGVGVSHDVGSMSPRERNR